MNNTNVFKYMKRDLKVKKYDGESNELYCARLLYSGMSFWIKTASLDRDILQNKLTTGTSKAHLLMRCERVLEEFLQMYPILRKWYYPDSSNDNPIDIIRQRMLKAGELMEIGFQANVAIPLYQEYALTEDISITRGLKPDFNMGFSSGIAWLKINQLLKGNSKQVDIFQLPNIDALNYTEKFIKEVNWERAIMDDQKELFDASIKKSLSHCWRNDLILKTGEVTIFRKYLGHNLYEYYLVKKANNQELLHRIDEYLKEQNEVRRLLYGLRMKAGNPVSATVKSHKGQGIVELHLYSKLPQKEENILLLLGWPQKDITDINNLIFVEEVWSYITKVLKNLNIQM